MQFFILLIVLFIPLIAVSKLTTKKNKFEIDHNFTFLFGYLFYWIFPLISGSLNMFADQPLMDQWYRSFSQISEPTRIVYLLVCFSAWILFFTGSLMGSRIFEGGQKSIISTSLVLKHGLNETKFRIGFALAMVLDFIAIYQVKDLLFLGYSVDIDPSIPREGVGLLVGTTSILFTFLLVKSFIDRAKTLVEMFSNIYAIIYIISVICVFSMGTRLYLMSQILMLGIYFNVFSESINTKKTIANLRIIVNSVFIVSAFAVYGITRMGAEYTLSLDNIAFSFFGEPIYTSFSLVSFLELDKVDFFRYPIMLIIDFINLLPSFILPEKTQLLSRITDVYSPLGALHSFPSFMINFGIIGTMAVLFIFGFILGRMKIMARKRFLTRLIYILISGNLAFTFFRDSFAVAIVKNILQFSVIFPLLIFYFSCENKRLAVKSE